MVVSLNRGPPYKPQNTIILILGTPKKVFLILGKPHVPNREILQVRVRRFGGLKVLAAVRYMELNYNHVRGLRWLILVLYAHL